MIPPSTTCEINCIVNFLRLQAFPSGTITKSVFLEQKRLHELGFPTWYGKMWQLATNYDIDLNSTPSKGYIKSRVHEVFQNIWRNKLNNIDENSKLRMYTTIKTEFKLEPHLYLVKNSKHRNAISKLRASSHTLEIERGRFTRPVTEIQQRLCNICKVVEDEQHFLLDCPLYDDLRRHMMTKICSIEPGLTGLSKAATFIFLLTNEQPEILKSVGKFIYLAFSVRSEHTITHST